MGFLGAMETLCGQAYGARNFRAVGVSLQRALLLTLLLCAGVAVVWSQVQGAARHCPSRRGAGASAVRCQQALPPPGPLPPRAPAQSRRLLLLAGQDPAIAEHGAHFLHLSTPALVSFGGFECLRRYQMAQVGRLPVAVGVLGGLSARRAGIGTPSAKQSHHGPHTPPPAPHPTHRQGVVNPATAVSGLVVAAAPLLYWLFMYRAGLGLDGAALALDSAEIAMLGTLFAYSMRLDAKLRGSPEQTWHGWCAGAAAAAAPCPCPGLSGGLQGRGCERASPALAAARLARSACASRPARPSHAGRGRAWAAGPPTCAWPSPPPP